MKALAKAGVGPMLYSQLAVYISSPGLRAHGENTFSPTSGIVAIGYLNI
jgi:hypothetical protein